MDYYGGADAFVSATGSESESGKSREKAAGFGGLYRVFG
jgi:hypothetical protein